MEHLNSYVGARSADRQAPSSSEIDALASKDGLAIFARSFAEEFDDRHGGQDRAASATGTEAASGATGEKEDDYSRRVGVRWCACGIRGPSGHLAVMWTIGEPIRLCLVAVLFDGGAEFDTHELAEMAEL